MINNYSIYTEYCYQWEITWHRQCSGSGYKSTLPVWTQCRMHHWKCISVFCKLRAAGDISSKTSWYCPSDKLTADRIFGNFCFPNRLHHCCARFVSGCGQQLFHAFGDPQCTPSTTTSDSTATEAALPDNTAAMAPSVAVVVIAVVAVTIIIIAISVIKSHRASLSLYQDAR